MNIRYPARSGQFYEAAPATLEHQARRLMEAVSLPADLPGRLFGAVVPHAGWTYSGKQAAAAVAALAGTGPLARVVIFGADHVGGVRMGEVFHTGVWRTPLGDVPVDEELAADLLAGCDRLRANPGAHEAEHSIEVQVPLLQAAWPEVRIVPVGVPAAPQAVEIGRQVGRVLAERFPDVRVIGSSDLTHHAGHFPAPGGRGLAGERWSRLNDRRMIELMEGLQTERVVPEVYEHENACGAGAIAATMAACRELGATRGICLDYTNSYEVVHALYPDESDDTTVGYAAVVFA